MSFLLDPPLLVASGAVAERSLGGDEQSITPARHVAALSLFALYPLWFRLGQALARS